VEKLLRVMLPEKLSQAAIALEMLLDLNTTPVEEVIGRLRVFEQRIQPDMGGGRGMPLYALAYP